MSTQATPSIAIVGAGMGGLSAAIHAAAAGLRVTVYEQNERSGGRANVLERQGFRFDTGPSLLNYPWVFEELFRVAGRHLHEHVTLMSVDPTMRFLWPNGASLELSSDIRRLASELERFEPGSACRLMEWLADGERRFDLVMRRIALVDERRVLAYVARVGMRNLLSAGFLGSMQDSLRRHFRSARVLEALGAYAMYLGGSPEHLPAAFAALPYGEIAYGLWLPRGGMYALVEAVEDAARALGVAFVHSTRVARVLVEGSRAVGLELADGTHHRHDAVILNADAPRARTQLLPRSPRPPRIPAMTPAVCTFYIALRHRPANIGHHTVFLPAEPAAAFRDLHENNRIPRELAFYTSVPSETDPSLAPAGGAALFILVPVPLPDACPEVAADELADRLRTSVTERLRLHGIRLPHEDVVYDEAWPPRVWQERFGLYRGSAFGAVHTRWQIGPWRWPNRDPEFRGVYYVGASTVPGTGLPTVTLSGRLTARRVAADVL